MHVRYHSKFHAWSIAAGRFKKTATTYTRFSYISNTLLYKYCAQSCLKNNKKSVEIRLVNYFWKIIFTIKFKITQMSLLSLLDEFDLAVIKQF